VRYADPAAKTILEYGSLRLISPALTGATAPMEFLHTVLFDTAPGYTRSDSGDTPSAAIEASGDRTHGKAYTFDHDRSGGPWLVG
jgi:hypothetical protein